MLSTLAKKEPLTIEGLDSLVSSATTFTRLTDYIRQSLVGRSVITTVQKNELFARLRELYPDQTRDIISRADETLNNRFAVLGFEPYQFDRRIEWHRDFVSGVAWRNDYYLSVPLIMWENRSDIKVPWELSRCHFLVWLAQAFRFTRDDRYARKLVELVNDWIESNPYPYGPNWTCAMEAAIRMLNWIAALEIVGECDAIDDEFLQRIYLSVFQHAIFIDENLEKIGNGLNTNHYLADLLGLLAAGSLFRELPRGDRWHSFAKAELEQEIMSQTLADGFCHESSLNYHMLTLEMYLIALAIESRTGEFSEDYLRRLKEMVHVTWALTKPDGTMPNLGDGDSGRIAILDGDPTQRPARLIDIAAALLKNSDHRCAIGRPPYDTILIAGENVARNAFELPEYWNERRTQSVCFEPSGLACMRKDDLFLFFAANQIGSGGLGGHKHNDMLSIEISIGSTNFVVDSGTYTYTSDQILRNQFRSTESHSVPTVSGAEQNRFLPRLLFALRSDAQVKVTKWESNTAYDLIEAEHSGFTRLEDPLMVLRKVFFDKEDGFWIFCDSFYGHGDHDFENNLIVGDATVRIDDESMTLLASTKSDQTLGIYNMTPLWRPSELDHSISTAYGNKTAARRLVYKLHGSAPQSMVWAAIPNVELGRDMRMEKARRRVHDFGWSADTNLRRTATAGVLSRCSTPYALSAV